MFAIEELIIKLLLNPFSAEQINNFLRDPRNTAGLIGGLIAICGALLGTFLLLRGMALVSDAISHTVLLGIVGVFLIFSALTSQTPDLASPWLIIGAAGAGVATVILTQFIERSGLVKQDAALGLAFPLLFAIAVILVSRYADDVHIDTDAVMVGEIGLAWANTNSHCIENCATVTITEDDPRAEVTRQCINCRELGISPRDDGAEFHAICTNCGTYSPGQAWSLALTTEQPKLVFWPKSISVMLLLTGLTIAFVLLFYKELKLTTFDAPLAQALGLRPGALTLALMVLVSLVAVGAFDAVGSILVIAFFIIPPATAYLLTDRLSRMLTISPLIGFASAYSGYDLARGQFFDEIRVSDAIALLNRAFGFSLSEEWNASISASIVLMMFAFFMQAWLFSPKYGLIMTLFRRTNQRRQFDNQVVLGHVYNHQGQPSAADELAVPTLYQHFHWSRAKMARVLTRLRLAHLVHIEDELLLLTPQGEAEMKAFRRDRLGLKVASSDEANA